MLEVSEAELRLSSKDSTEDQSSDETLAKLQSQVRHFDKMEKKLHQGVFVRLAAEG